MAVIKSIILPPGLLIMLGLAGIILLRRYHRTGYLLIMSSLLLSYTFSVPITAGFLMTRLETIPAYKFEQYKKGDADVIVVPGGGIYPHAPEYAQSTIKGRLMERLRFAAWLSHRTGLPILASGGSPDWPGLSEAELSAKFLTDEMNVEKVLVESRSTTTRENALHSKAIMIEQGLDTALLVTHAWHMPRAKLAFEQAGIKTIAAPTIFYSARSGHWLRQWLPDADAAAEIRWALHELIGRRFYHLTHPD